MTTTVAPDLAHAYAECERITREQARNFSYGIRLLAPDQRRSLAAVYAMARRIDDIGDGTLPEPQKLAALESVRRALKSLPDADTVGGSVDSDPVMLALADVVARYPLPVSALEEIVDGCELDVSGQRYRTFEELVGYCRCVAGSVGRLCVGIYRPADLDRAWPLADTLGIALQQTNILRDLLEDRLVDRIYLPAEDLERFGCTLDVDDEGHLTDPPERFARLVRFEASRAEEWYAEGLQLLPLLDRRSAACTAAMAGIYRRLLHRIAADPQQVRVRRVSLPTRTKLGVAARALGLGSV